MGFFDDVEVEMLASSRVGSMDLMRGFAILCMAVYHGLFSLVYLFGVPLPWFSSPLLSDIAVPLMGGSFVLLAGMSSRFSRKPLKRGLQTLGCGLLMTAVTALATPDLIIRFGVLHLLGSCMILGYLLRPALDRLPTGAGIATFLALFSVTYHLPDGYLGCRGLFAVGIRTELSWLYPLGMPGPAFYSSDYYPLIPWFFLFAAGMYLGRWVKAGKAPKWVYPSRIPWLEAVGRHTLWIYLLHQPVMIALFWLWFQMFPLK